MDRPNTLATDRTESQVIPLYLGGGFTDFYILSWIANFVWSSFHSLFKARLRTNLTLLGATNVKEGGSIAGHGSWKSSHQSWRTLTVPRKLTIKRPAFVLVYFLYWKWGTFSNVMLVGVHPKMSTLESLVGWMHRKTSKLRASIPWWWKIRGSDLCWW